MEPNSVFRYIVNIINCRKWEVCLPVLVRTCTVDYDNEFERNVNCPFERSMVNYGNIFFTWTFVYFNIENALLSI